MSWRDRFGHLARTVETVFPGDRELDALFALDRPLRVKLGLDLTATTVHIGNEIQLRILGRFQELGHTAVLILGDFTTLIGDPSGRDKTRPVLTEAEIEANSATWLDQIGAVVDVEKAEVRRNSEWLGALTARQLLELAGQLTVAQMLERDSFSLRYAAGTPIHLHEFLYCLIQGYDSVAIRADVELGGSDQTFNLNIGRTLQKHAGQKPQVCITTPLLEGVDGAKKMSKSLGNCIGMQEPPTDMFGLATRVPDELVAKYFRLATDVADEEARRLAERDIWSAKKAMAEALTARHYGADVARKEREQFERVHAQGEQPDEIEEMEVDLGEHGVVALLKRAFGMSGGEAKRLVQQGGVTLDGEKVTDPKANVAAEGGEVLRAGKRKWVRLKTSS